MEVLGQILNWCDVEGIEHIIAAHDACSLLLWQPVHEQILLADRLPAIVATDYAREPCKHMGPSHCDLCGVCNQRSLGRLWSVLLRQGVQ